MANKSSTGYMMGSRENPISLDDDPVMNTSYQRQDGQSRVGTDPKTSATNSQQGWGKGKSAASTSNPQKKQSTYVFGTRHEPWKNGPSDEDFFAPEARPRGDGDYGAYILRQQLRRGSEAEEEKHPLDLSEDEEWLVGIESDTDEEVKPKKRGKKQKGPVQKRWKPAREPKVSSSKAMDHLMARVTDKSRRDD
ncbi:hypothetical protein F4813DRAFT_385703 [Daldinia decipiens]|uniref:uncharacterized protein n=1 Tax=Daldinia decipiens TaxID=326647 RepID=UPI0020C1CEC6|nr:uncharacterized protein F4813DRAFT_385703 [Daldinia decipiens]KAI1661168.1 hypothetical protein F4813DRAFT_385703 [Daldinia decipiens]